WDHATFEESGMKVTFDQMVPTLLIVKLSAAIEDALDVLWARRFPEVEPRRLRHDDKLQMVERLHKLKAGGIRELWKLRNECAHSAAKMATWADFDKHFGSADAFVQTFRRETQPRKRRTSQP